MAARAAASAGSIFRRSFTVVRSPTQIEADVVVAGAGAVGLAVARALCLGVGREKKRDVLVLDARSRHGAGVSSRSSEVVHAGLYYSPGSLKARNCVEGSRRLYEYCSEKGVRARKVGKLVVAPSSSNSSAAPSPTSSLEALLENARACGVRGDVRLVSAREAREMEPALWRSKGSGSDRGDDVAPAGAAAGALYSPESGIFDSHAFLDALAADVESSSPSFSSSDSSSEGGGGGVIVPRAALVGGDVSRASNSKRKLELLVRTSPSAELLRVRANALVCAAGMGTCRLLHGDEVDDDDSSPSSTSSSPPGFVPGLRGWPRPEALPPREAFVYAKGNYFTLRGGGGAGRGANSPPSPFSRLIYPLPDPSLAGLGIHATLDLEGRTRFGPDVEWLPEGEAREINGRGKKKKRDSFDDDGVVSLAGPEPSDVDSSRVDSFYAAIRSYWPELPDGALMPDYAGVRPKLMLSPPSPSSPSYPEKDEATATKPSSSDFFVAGPSAHGARGVVVVAGIESPGLTASLALADEIVRALDEGE